MARTHQQKHQTTEQLEIHALRRLVRQQESQLNRISVHIGYMRAALYDHDLARLQHQIDHLDALVTAPASSTIVSAKKADYWPDMDGDAPVTL